MAPPESCPSVTSGELRRSAQASVDWFVRNQNPDGTWLYQYNAEDDSTSAEYNPVRHSGATMGLYQAAAAGLPGALRSADRGTAWALDRLSSATAGPRSTSDGQIATGTTALLAAGLVDRREATGDTRYDDVLARLGRFLVAQTQPSGAVLASYDSANGRPVAGDYSKYYTGEAYWALARLHRISRTRAGARPPIASAPTWRPSRDEVEDHWPPIPDHWAAYGMAETVKFPERGRPPLTAGRARLRAPAGRAVRRPGALGEPALRAVGRSWCAARYMPRGGGYGVISEALTGLWLTARAEPRLADLRAADRRARHLHRLARREAQSDRDGRRERRPAGSGSRAPGSSTARPAWTTSSTRWRGCCARSRSSRPARPIRRRRRTVGLAVGGRPPARAQPGPGRLRGPPRGRSRRAVVRLALAGGAIGALFASWPCSPAIRCSTCST